MSAKKQKLSVGSVDTNLRSHFEITIITKKGKSMYQNEYSSECTIANCGAKNAVS